MARAKARSWIKLVAGLVVGAAVPPLFTTVVPFAVSGSVLLAAPLPDRPLPVHEALNNAIECHRSGDYEAAEELFKYVDQCKAELSEPERQETARFWHENSLALAASREGTRVLRLIDKAVQEGRVADANELLKTIQPSEPYLTARDKAKFKELCAQLKGQPIELPRPIPVTPTSTGLVKPLSTGFVSGSGSYDTNVIPPTSASAKPTLADGRAKLQQARAELTKANIELAEKLVREAERMGVNFPSAEDTPAKVLQDIAKARGDAKTLLLAARAAMGRQEFDAAEKYAKQSEAVAGVLTFPMWADSPSKVLKELKEMKEAQGTAAKAPPPPVTPTQQPTPPVVAAPTPTTTLPTAPVATVQTTSSNKPAAPAQPAQPAPDAQTDKARTLLRQGRKALDEHKLDLAKQLAEQAKALHPKLDSWEETPDKLLADVGRAEALAHPDKPAEKKLPTTKEEAVALVKKARTQLAEGQIEDAEMSVLKARSVKNISWGLFDDSPESALKDIEKARVKRDQAEAVKVLDEGRKKLALGDWEAAQRAAYRAQKLHGPYGVMDFGDRPDKLLADAQALHLKQPHNVDTSNVNKKDDKHVDTSVVKKDDKHPDAAVQPVSMLPPATQPKQEFKVTTPLPSIPASSNSEPQATVVPPLPPIGTPASAEAQAHRQAMQMLSDARQALRIGDLAKAKALTDRVAVMKVTYTTGEDCPALIYKEILRLNQTPAAPVASNQVMGSQPIQPTGPAPEPQVKADAAKAKAVQLVVEARRLQVAGKYVEARQKCLEAVATQATFGPDEDDPKTILSQVQVMAKQEVDALSVRATELANYGTGEPLARYQHADEMLQKALYISKMFGLDAATIDLKAIWLQETRARAMGQPVPQPVVQAQATNTVPSQPTTLPGQPTPVDPPQLGKAPPQPSAVAPQQPLVQKGRQLLDQARAELRAGATAQARNLAMEAMKDEFGIVAEATAVLRSIDIEALNQKCLDDQNTYEAAEACFRRGDFAQATVLLGNLDPRNLKEQQKERLRELIQTPGMMNLRRDSVAQANANPNDPAMLTSSGSPTDVGHSRASDAQPVTQEKDILTENAALRNVLFQKLRADGFRVQNDATEKFRAGDMDQALDALRIYLDNLNTVSNLDTNQLTLLRKPVESRLKHLELMKLTEENKSQDKLASGKTLDARKQRLAAEDAKQKKVADLMKQCNALIKDHKLQEAHRLALVVQEMDPDNEAVTALVLMSELKANLDVSLESKKRLETYFFDALTDTDNYGNYLSNKNPIEFDLERTKNAQTRKSLDQMIQRKSLKMLMMERKLATPVTVSFKDVTMHQAIDDLRQSNGLNIEFDDASLQNISLDRTITLQLDNVTLKSTLDVLLKKLNLGYVIHEDRLEVTTKENAKGHLIRYTYPVADLIIPVDNSMLAGTPMLPGQQGQNGSGSLSNLGNGGYAATPISSLQGGVSVAGTGIAAGTPMGNLLPSPENNDNPNIGSYGHTLHKKKYIQTREDALIKLITNTIEPGSWSDAGGPGTIDYFPLAGALVINETLDIQEQVADLLQALRRLQDQEVAIEVRLITVDEDYYERIGVDFSMDIATNSRNNKFEPALLNNVFAPNNQFNTAATGAANGLLGGLTPAGTLTPDLSIPITPNSFSPAAPTFGGYQGSGVGGLAMGLAFLSDIQVSMFIEAVAGDARSSISQSPRLTLQNGEQSTMSVIENLENLVTGVQLVQLPNGGYSLVPQVQPINNEVDLQLSAVISADRRFVRLTPQLNLTNVSISNPAPAPTPILLPIYPTTLAADPGNAVVYTQYIQQPQRISSININTTVTVPDGGTVVMGGLKRMSEGRLEYGPPVLSKIPYINRLFRNVGYGRTGTSILIMVTPRIIIQEEEEERATGFQIRNAAGQ